MNKIYIDVSYDEIEEKVFYFVIDENEEPSEILATKKEIAEALGIVVRKVKNEWCIVVIHDTFEGTHDQKEENIFLDEWNPTVEELNLFINLKTK